MHLVYVLLAFILIKLSVLGALMKMFINKSKLAVACLLSLNIGTQTFADTNSDDSSPIQIHVDTKRIENILKGLADDVNQAFQNLSKDITKASKQELKERKEEILVDRQESIQKLQKINVQLDILGVVLGQKSETISVTQEQIYSKYNYMITGCYFKNLKENTTYEAAKQCINRNIYLSMAGIGSGLLLSMKLPRTGALVVVASTLVAAITAGQDYLVDSKKELLAYRNKIEVMNPEQRRLEFDRLQMDATILSTKLEAFDETLKFISNLERQLPQP